jgi:hypothetical protein
MLLSVQRALQGLAAGSYHLTSRKIGLSLAGEHKYSLCLAYKQANSVALVRERTIPAEQPPLVDEVNACQLLRIEGCGMVSVTDPYVCILDFLDWGRYYFFQVAPQLYSRG